VVDARVGPGADQRDDLPGHIGGPGRLAVLIVYDVDGRPLVLKLDHRCDETRPVRSVQPCRPDDIARLRQPVEHGPLAGQLGTSVGGTRRRGVILGVRPGRITGEDVIGRDLYQAGAG
jgi:hypothetical protein